MKNIIPFLPLVWTLSAVAQVPAAPTFIFEKLADTRGKVTLPELSIEDKRIILDQAKLILKDVFVHRDLKIKNFGPSADPLPSLEELGKKIDTVSTIQFHKEMLSAFQRLNDWHTTYRLPAPYNCYRSMLPAAFKAVKDEFGNEVIAVDSIVDKPEVLRLLPPDVKFNVGDVLVNYNGLTTAQVINTNIQRSLGANAAAKKRDAVYLLSVLSQRYFFFPQENEVAVTLKDKAGNLKSFNVPWITRASKECLNPPVEEETGHKSEKDWQRDFNQIYKRPQKKKFKAPGDLQDSLEPIVKYKIIRNEFGTFSYLRVDSFSPEKLSVMDTIAEIRRLLEGPLAEGEGLIIDLRDNPGGQILLGEAMVQLLNFRNSVPMNFALKNSKTNQHFFKNSGYAPEFREALENAERQNLAYTIPQPLNTTQSLNTLGQSFMKPVALFINASCYSTCDMISASMQDLGAGIIVGEDPNTGAGGANNWSHSTLYDMLPEDNKGELKELPGKVSIGFSFRQTSRTGLHAGELIEDVGVRADMNVPATVEDLGTSNNQLRVITRKLAQEAVKFRSWVKLTDGPNYDVRIGQRPKINLKWDNIDEIEVHSKGEQMGSIDLEVSNREGRELLFPAEFSTTVPETNSVELIGKNQGQKAWRKVIRIRNVAEPITLTRDRPIVQGFELDHRPLIIYNVGSSSENGWKLKDGQLRIGSDSENYKSNLNSQATIFAHVTDASSLSFKAQLYSEEGYDFLTVSVVVDGVENQHFLLSGYLEMKNYEIPLTPYKGKNIEIRFTFESDGNTESIGPIIDDLVIK